jgi:hypothetical protein
MLSCPKIHISNFAPTFSGQGPDTGRMLKVDSLLASDMNSAFLGLIQSMRFRVEISGTSG